MKYLIVIIALFCIGCGKGPSSVNGDCPATPSYCNETERYGDQCLTFGEYAATGKDMTADSNACYEAAYQRTK